MRALALLIWLGPVATAAASPAHCPANKKPFYCYRLALNAHLGLDGAVDLADAKALYAEMCAKSHAASCNNLAVLALAHPELGEDVDASAVFAKACNRSEYTACGNARRLTAAREFAIELALLDTELTLDEKRWGEVVRAACRAGDVFRCDDPASRQRVATVLASECRAGVHETCFDAATRAGDEEAFASLMGIACTAHQGKACVALATRKAAGGATDAALADLWEGACTDKDFDGSEEGAMARSEACARWGRTAKQKPVQLRVARIAASYCSGGEASACAIAEELYDRAGDHAKAFAIAKQWCDLNERGCRDVAERYVIGNGTPVAIAKGVAMLGGRCPDELAWPTCRKVGRYLEDHKQHADAANSYASYCDSGNDEACYLRARAFEADGHDGTCGNAPSVLQLKASYDALCKRNYHDACQRSTTMCARAMADFAKPDECGWGMGDGIERFGVRYWTVVELCPKASWTPAVRAKMKQIDVYCEQFEASGGQCER